MRKTAAGFMALVVATTLAAFGGVGCGGLGINPDAGDSPAGATGSGGGSGGDQGSGGAGTGGEQGTGGVATGTGGEGTGGEVADAGIDAPTMMDAPADQPVDVPRDTTAAPMDTGPEAPRDAAADAVADVPRDVAGEHAVDAGSDATPDSANDAADGPGQVFFPIEPCPDPEDYTAVADTTATITFAPFSYAPQCLKVAKGTMVTFSGSFADHPLAADPPVGTDATGPIVDTDSGSDATFTFGDPGFFPYHCVRHQDLDMIGVVWVTD